MLTLLLAFEHWLDRRAERRSLLGLDDRMLQDIGVSRADAEHEARRSNLLGLL